MHAPTNDEDWAKPDRLSSWDGSDSLSAWEGDRCVGHVAGFRFDTLVPGGAWVATSGVTRVGVLSTHRRRGLMRALLTRLLTEAAEPRPGARQPAGQRDADLPTLRFRARRLQRRGDDQLSGRAADLGCRRPGTMRLLRPDEILADRRRRLRPGRPTPRGAEAPAVDVAALPREGDRARRRRRVRRRAHVRRRRRRRVGALRREVGRGTVDAAPRHRRDLRPLGDHAARRAGVVGLPLQRRSGRRVVRRGASRRRLRPVRRRRHACLPDEVAVRRTVAAHPRRRCRAHGATLRRHRRCRDDPRR